MPTKHLGNLSLVTFLDGTIPMVYLQNEKTSYSAPYDEALKRGVLTDPTTGEVKTLTRAQRMWLAKEASFANGLESRQTG